MLVSGIETWAVKGEDLAWVGRTERMMVQRMCGVSIKNRKSNQIKNIYCEMT